MMELHNNSDRPIFPATIYFFKEDGTHHGGTTVNSLERLNRPLMQALLRAAILMGVEVMITDPDDACLLHAKDGKVIFPTEAQVKEVLEKEKGKTPEGGGA